MFPVNRKHGQSLGEGESFVIFFFVVQVMRGPNLSEHGYARAKK
jgi:hypothetical protein